MTASDSKDKKQSKKELLVRFKKYITTPQGMKRVGIAFGIMFFIFLVMKACEPAKGSILYGVCGSFLEQQIEFPETIEKNYVEQYSAGVRIYYSHIDGFGQYLTEFIECSFENVPQKGTQLQGVVFNTIKASTKKTPVKNKGRLYAVEQKYIDLFNESHSLEAIAEQPNLDLTLPYNDPSFL